MAIIINADGTERHLAIPEENSLEVLQGAVGGYIQIIATNDGRLCVLNEEGKMQGLPVNEKATALTRGIVADHDLIVGNVIIADNSEID